MDRGSINRNTRVTNSYGGITAGVIILGIIVVAILVVIVISRRPVSRGDIIGGGGASECIISLDCTDGKVCDTTKGICVSCVSDGDCPSSTGVCDTTDNTCKECINDGNCPFGKPNCNPTNATCYECLSTSECSGVRPICDIPNELCVQCLNDSQCGGSTPLCSATNNYTCVECRVAGDCFSGVCLGNGVCCDLTAPSLLTFTLINTTQAPSIAISYSSTQAPSISTVILEISDPNNTVIWTSGGLPSTGLITHSFGAGSYPRLFYNFLYYARVRISSSCGITGWSNYVSAITAAAPTSNAVRATIVSASANGSGGTIVTNGIYAPIFGCGIGYWPEVLISPTATLDPNFSQQALDEFPANTATTGICNVSFNWPFPVTNGQQFYLRITSDDPFSGGTGSVSNAVLVTVVIPPPP